MGKPINTTLVLSGLALHVTPLCAAQDSLPTSLDAYVAGAIRSMDLPGAAIAVVKDGRVIVAKGYGAGSSSARAVTVAADRMEEAGCI